MGALSAGVFQFQAQECNFQLIASLVSVQNRQQSVAMLVRSKGQEFDQRQHIATALTQLYALGWHQITQLSVNPHVLSEVMAQLNRSQLSSLTQFSLAGSNLGPAWVQQLGHGVQLQNLNSLALTYANLGADAIAALTTTSMPNLINLDLDHNRIDASAVIQLVKGRFPRLESLDLTQNSLTDAALAHLAKGQWPGLKFLLLVGNAVTVLGLEHLLQGGRPFMSFLSLDSKAVSAATWNTLGLAGDASGAEPGPLGHFLAHRPASPIMLAHDHVVWPKMKHVNFVY